ncbi:uncharacterized protein TRAVEDRAFT_152538 [Trametes versicolor FP-101664 SS1]|uniref:uncharacterized protein n=1 Tax=Trametes versicolor (strain FP-101664) TaxID=717944 RepID=UPI0004622846|nr:uncharacterized protein TRAVEDRAFT_152538 [Trametes versicolor FP-101664 SS1]EIW55987.1 hypothetical protein TRAVEDRAFT_152538 [Trametes versicolor FP-101664 SS1]
MAFSEFSSVGKKKLGVHVLLIVLDVIALALAARVNIFQEFYFMADLFPLGLAIATLIILFFTLVLDLTIKNMPTARPAVDVGLLYVLSIFWLAFNAFSTSRWRNIPMNCSSIPEEYPDERTWCRDVQALKSFVWIEFVALFFTASFILRYAITEHKRGRKQIWNGPLSRYVPRDGPQRDQFSRQTVTDYFGARGTSAFEKF